MSREGSNTIWSAAERGDAGKVKNLLDEGKDVNGRNCLGCTPLLYASGSGNIDTVRNVEAVPDVVSTVMASDLRMIESLKGHRVDSVMASDLSQRAMVFAQLVDWSLPTINISSSMSHSRYLWTIYPSNGIKGQNRSQSG